MTPEAVASALLDPRQIEDPAPFHAQLRRESPVVQAGTSGIFLLASAAAVREAVARPELSSRLTGLWVREADGRLGVFDMTGVGDSADVLATADEPAHAAHRRAVQPALTLGRVARLEPWIRERARQRVRALVARGGGDYVAAVADPLPSEVVSKLLGLPAEDLARVQRWAMQGGAMLAGVISRAELAALAAEAAESAAHLARHFARARDDAALRAEAPLLDALARAVEDGALAERRALGIAVILLGAGGESTAAWIGSAARLLAERPALQAQLHARPALVPAFLEEALRLEPPFRFHFRHVVRECEIAGVRLPAGARAALLWASANRDEAFAANPDEIDLARPHLRDHLSFGRGLHFCVGAPLARLEARVVLEELLAATREVALDPSAPPRHLASLFVRRLATLPLRVMPRA